MAEVITIHEPLVSKLLEIAWKLRAEGFVQGTDFDFAYHPQSAITIKRADFTFHNPELAVWFCLKYL